VDVTGHRPSELDDPLGVVAAVLEPGGALHPDGRADVVEQGAQHAQVEVDQQAVVALIRLLQDGHHLTEVRGAPVVLGQQPQMGDAPGRAADEFHRVEGLAAPAAGQDGHRQPDRAVPAGDPLPGVELGPGVLHAVVGDVDVAAQHLVEQLGPGHEVRLVDADAGRAGPPGLAHQASRRAWKASAAATDTCPP
jgi:hypothetical protein